jgi:AraC family transcriptional regulator
MNISLADTKYGFGAPVLRRPWTDGATARQAVSAQDRLAFPGSSPGDLPHSDDYAVVLARLLEAADRALEGDAASARDYIARALALLCPNSGRVEQADNRHRSAPMPCVRGGLAPWQIRKLVDYVEANCAEDLHGADMARIARLSTSYFIRAFKASFGVTPHAYVIRRRIAQAMTMMLETDAPLGRIALACGFSDQAHFCRRFRQATGTRPQNWRGARRVMPANSNQDDADAWVGPSQRNERFC